MQLKEVVKVAIDYRDTWIGKTVCFQSIECGRAVANLSSLAASLDRIEIKCRDHASTMIAVVDKERFLCEMKKRNSAIAIR